MKTGLRTLGRLAAALTLAAGLAACGDDNDPPASDSAPDAEGTSSTATDGDDPAAMASACTGEEAPADGEVVIAFGGGSVEQTFRESIIPAAQEDTGLEVIYSAGAQPAQIAQVIAQGGSSDFDLLITTFDGQQSASTAGVLSEIDPDSLPALAEIGDDVVVGDPATGIQMGSFATGLTYNVDALKEAGIPVPDEWDDLFAPEFEGRIGLTTPPRNGAVVLAQTLNYLDDGDPGDLEPALRRLAELRPSVSQAFSGLGEVGPAFASGDVWLYPGDSVQTSLLAASGLPLAISFPEEGTISLPEIGVIPSGAGNKAGACVLLDWLLGDRGQEEFAKLTFVPVRDDVPIAPEIAPFLPPAETELVPIQNLSPQPDLAEFTEMWNQIVGVRAAGE